MNLDISEHLVYNQYKEKLNEIFTKLDEVLYISNTIDYKKITILLAEIVQNFDYYNKDVKDVIPSAKAGEEEAGEVAVEEEAVAVAKAAEAVVGGKRGRRKVKGGAVDDIPTRYPQAIPETTPEPTETTPEPTETTPEPTETTEPETEATSETTPEPPYSKIDDESINHIIEDAEYKNLVSYLENTKTRIDDKGEKLKTKVDEFINVYLRTLEIAPNRMIRDDYLKQHSGIVFKLEDIIRNIEKINEGIHNESTAEAKINVDLMTNKWYLFNFGKDTSSFTTWYRMLYRDIWYRWFKKPFAKDAHVINADKLTKELYNAFQKELHDIYVKLHKGFPQSEGKKLEIDINLLDFNIIKIKIEGIYKKLKEKADADAKDEEVEEAEEAEDEADTETKADTTKVDIEMKEAEKAEEAKADTKEVDIEMKEAEEAETDTKEAKKAEKAEEAETDTKEAKKAEKAEEAEEADTDTKKADTDTKEAETDTKEAKADTKEAKADTKTNTKEAKTNTKEAKADTKDKKTNESTRETEADTSVSPEDDVMNEAVKRIEEGKKVRAKAEESALKAKEKLMKIEEEAKATKEALATQKAEIEAKARALVLEKRDAFEKAKKGFQDSTNFTALLGKSPNIKALQQSMKT